MSRQGGGGLTRGNTGGFDGGHTNRSMGGGSFQPGGRPFHPKESVTTAGGTTTGGRPRHGGGNVNRSARLKPPPTPKLFGDVPTKQHMLEVLGASIAPSAPKVAGTLPFIQRQAKLESQSPQTQRGLIHIGLRAQQTWRTDANAMSTLIRSAFASVVKTIGGIAPGELMNEPAEMPDSQVRQNVVDHALMVLRDLDGLLSLAQVYEETRQANAALEANLATLRQELEDVKETRKQLEHCDRGAALVLQKRSLPLLQERIAMEEEKVRNGLLEVEAKRRIHEERSAQLRQIQEELKGVMNGILAVQSPAKPMNPVNTVSQQPTPMVNDDEI